MSSTAKKKTAEADQTLTPMMAQYMEVKEQYPDCLLFYRMGDFYELFFEDAVEASATLDITLTKRGRKNGEDIPMCGVPVHSHESYLSKLIRNGFKVAVCEQVETPEEAKKRGGYKALVKRDVVRVITQGTLTEDNLLDRNANNYLASLAEAGQMIGFAWLDLSTGDFTLQPVTEKNLAAVLERVGPSEILMPERLCQNENLFETFAALRDKLTVQPDSRFDSENARKRLEEMFGVGTLESFGGFCRAEIAAAGALLDYVELTQKDAFPRLSPPKQLQSGTVMEIDAATRRNLELTHTLSGERRGSLLHSIDRTVTGAGARLLARDLSAPLTEPVAIDERLDMVGFFAALPRIRDNAREFLKHCADVERALARLSLGRGGPRDLAAVRDTLSQTVELHRLLTDLDGAADISEPPEGIAKALEKMEPWGHKHPLIDKLKQALADDLPLMARDGGFIAKGYAPQLDKLRTLRDESRRLIAGLQKKYADLTGINSLKVKHNNVLGYFVEVTSNHADKMLARSDKTDEENAFIHRQTLANSVRFSTVELSELERQISEAADKSLAVEQELFNELCSEVLAQAEVIVATAQALARIDVSAALAELAVSQNYVCPEIDDSLTFDIKGGRHPVVEVALKKSEGEDFIANDCTLDEESRLWLLTGPNMAGKSTFLRQNALIALLAQMGSYVPADSAHIGVVDRVFSRVGAADDLARGRSTFMVEMVETATILNQAGDRSLVILDEIGRGTATFDGLSIAWACIENLHDVNNCRTLFATHYHELTTLAARLERLSCHTMRIREWKGDVIFLHEVAEGTADRSYGIHVAQLAGLPEAVIKRAGEVLATLEEGEHSGNLAKLSNDLPLFTAVLDRPAKGADTSEVEKMLETIQPDALTPREALDMLYELKQKLLG